MGRFDVPSVIIDVFFADAGAEGILFQTLRPSSAAPARPSPAGKPV
jgi:hypothetical protein